MALDATARRRWFGAIVLLVALAMLICGETVLKEKLGNLTFILYWLACFGFTGLAIVVAFLDARALSHRTRQEQRDLFEATLKEIERKTKTRPHQRNRRRGGS
jgi:membrane protein implicated in regulation of membrane protease activity